MKTVTLATRIHSNFGLHVSIFGEDGQSRGTGRANHHHREDLYVTRPGKQSLLLQYHDDEMWVDVDSGMKFKLFENA